MRKSSVKISLIAMLVVGSFVVNAQTSSWPVSKDVQRYANKSMLADENLRKSHIEAKSVDFPSIVVSKRVIRKDNVSTGNVRSTGYPMWTVSKGVNRYSNK